MGIARRLFHALLIALTLVVGAVAAAVIVVETGWFKDWLRLYIEREAARYLNGRLSIERLGGNLFFGVELEDIGVSLDGARIFTADDVGLNYDVFEIISRGVSIDEIRLNRPVLRVRREGETWSLARLIKKSDREADRRGPEYPIAIGDIGISNGSIVVEGSPAGTSGVVVPQRIDRLDAAFSFNYEPVRYSLDINHVSFRGSEPAFGLNALSGRVSVRDDAIFVEDVAIRSEETSLSLDGAVRQYLTTPVLNVRLSSDKLSLAELSRFIPALERQELQPAFELNLDGPLDRLKLALNVRSSAGDLSGTMLADVLEPVQSLAGEASVRHLNLAPILADPRRRSDLTADVKLDLRTRELSDLNALSGSASIDSPRVSFAGYQAERVAARARFEGRRVAIVGRGLAYGADLAVGGRLTIPATTAPLLYDLSGRAKQLDLRRFPANLDLPRAETNLDVGYQIRGSVELTDQSESRAGDMTADLQFGESRVAGARIASGSSAHVSIERGDVSYQASAEVADLDLERLGHDFQVPALATDRYRSTLNGRINVIGRGTRLSELDATASGSLVDSSILGGQIPQLSFDVRLADDRAHVTAAGTVAGFDPAISSGRPNLKGDLTGDVNVDATVSRLSEGVSIDSASGSVKASLAPSMLGGVAIERADVDADYRDQLVTVRQLDVVGRDLNARASGTVALDTTGQSKLTFSADATRVEELAGLAMLPLTGIAKLEGTLTGNRSEFQASGTFAGNGLKYAETAGALTLTSQYQLRVPNLSFDEALVSADTSATFVTLGGQNINELSVTASYAAKEVAFEAAARQPQRSLTAAGSVALHPDHQEIHLEQLLLDAGALQWRLNENTQPAIRYGGGALSLDGLTLVSGDQQITASGTFGQPDAALDVTLSNVDLAGVDAVLLREPQFSGRLNAEASLSGTQGAPSMSGKFQVSQGGFRQFRYETFGGTIAFAERGFIVDARLQQSEALWITAKGHVPASLLSAEQTDEPIDFSIDSSPIDLGIVQGFTTLLTDVTGTLEAHIRVTGSAADPQPMGVITFDQGTATIEPTGVPYNHIAGRIDLFPDRLHIDQITVLDDEFNALSVTGDLAVQQRRLSGGLIYINAENFKAIDNQMGNARIHSSLELGGELASPRVEGYFGLTTGSVNLDEVIARTTDSAYATTQTEYASTASEAEEGSRGGLFDRLTVDVGLTVPNDLVVRASSLQAPGAPIGLGSLIVTLGGDLRVTKEPNDQMRLQGLVNTIRGTYDFQGRRFDILRDGTVRFEGLDRLDPTLNIRTQRTIQAVQANVDIRGTVQQPEIVLTSTPPLEEADILSLIVFNQPINQLGEDQQLSLAARAQSLAASAVTTQISQSLGRALNLDTFEINLAPEAGGSPQLTIGEQLGRNLYLRVQQALGGEDSTNVILEYELLEWLRLQTNLMQGGSAAQSLLRQTQSSGADLIFFFSY